MRPYVTLLNIFSEIALQQVVDFLMRVWYGSDKVPTDQFQCEMVEAGLAEAGSGSLKQQKLYMEGFTM